MGAPGTGPCGAGQLSGYLLGALYSTTAGLTLVAAIELIGPGNKDRPEQRQAFAIKCASYLHQGVSLIVIDIVTSRRANLYNEIIALLPSACGSEMPAQAALYAAAYRPVLCQACAEIEIWPATFSVGDPLPELPLHLTGDLFVPVDFEATYQEACRRRGWHEPHKPSMSPSDSSNSLVWLARSWEGGRGRP